MPYNFGERTSHDVEVREDPHCEHCACCGRKIWCGGFNVCFDCRTNDCESVHDTIAIRGEW